MEYAMASSKFFQVVSDSDNITSSKFFKAEDFYNAYDPDKELSKSAQLDYLYAWCMMEHAKRKANMRQMCSFTTLEVFNGFKYEIKALEFLAYLAVQNNNLYCDIAKAAEYVDIPFDSLYNLLDEFGLLEFNKSSSTVNFADTKLRDYFAARYLVACYTKKSVLSGFEHEWQSTGISLKKAFLKLSLADQTSTLQANVIHFSEELNCENLKSYLNSFNHIDNLIIDLINDGYKIQLQTPEQNSSTLSIKLIKNEEISIEKSIRDFIKLATKFAFFDQDKMFVISVCEKDSNILNISGKIKLLNLLEIKLANTIEVANSKVENQIVLARVPSKNK